MRKNKKNQWRIRYQWDINPLDAPDVVDITFDDHEDAVLWIDENLIHPREPELGLNYGDPGYDEAYEALCDEVWQEVEYYNVADKEAAVAAQEAHLAKIEAEQAAKKAEERAKMTPEEREAWDFFDNLSPDEQLTFMKRLFKVA